MGQAFIIGDVVCRAAQGRRMLVVDQEPGAVTCAWRDAPNASVQEKEYRASALRLVRRPGSGSCRP